MFLLSDTQIINETFLEDINNILNAGEACKFRLIHFSSVGFLGALMQPEIDTLSQHVPMYHRRGPESLPER